MSIRFDECIAVTLDRKSSHWHVSWYPTYNKRLTGEIFNVNQNLIRYLTDADLSSLDVCEQPALRVVSAHHLINYRKAHFPT